MKSAESYGMSSRDYLERAETLLHKGGAAELFYAAFEIRCGIESRMLEYLNAWDHISKSKKKGWKISEIARNLESEFKLQNKTIRWAAHHKVTGELLSCLYHTPVSPVLQDCGEKLGNYLHSMKQSRQMNDPWWTDFRHLLSSSSAKLREANTGTLLGPPLMKVGSNEVRMQIEIHDRSNPSMPLLDMKGAPFISRIDYLDSLPDELESQSHRWPGY
ncbi:hypothetical protein HTY52_12730 [Cupriavidus taiwanensis]|uniref:hypothetical protein n=1 Tax=Cupriavidus taiwanensis TaxID=164546 RepID=UPI00157473F0|nr:hypothetical protein [Cupriavidus taiwanensis]NSX14940.1 hypothetical protein [Cupriavidus taiwanensis]